MTASLRTRPGRRRTSRRRRALLAAAPVAALLVAAAVIIAAGHHGGASRPAAPAVSTGVPGSAPAAVAPAPPVDMGGWRWRYLGGVKLPFSPVSGPRTVSGPLASGFADDPPGAVLAAVNIAVRTGAQFGPAVFVPTIKTQVTGPDAGALLAATQQEYRQLQGPPATAGQPPGRGFVIEEAFRWEGYTPQTATIDLVSAGTASGGGTVMAATRLQIDWLHGDWRLVAPPGGNFAASATQITSLSGYTIFPVR